MHLADLLIHVQKDLSATRGAWSGLAFCLPSTGGTRKSKIPSTPRITSFPSGINA